MRRLLITVCALLLTLATAGAAAASASRVPQGFAGIVVDSPLWLPQPGFDLDHQLDVMVATGVESVRVQFDWRAIEPYRSWADVPSGDRARFTDVDGQPLDLSQTDALAEACAQRGLKLLPLVTDAPDWDSVPQSGKVITQTPKDTAPYARFLTALIHRYGPDGSLWQSAPAKLALRTWVVWNEPNIGTFWKHQPNFAPSYVKLLKAAHDAIRNADPHATVVLAGLPNKSWVSVAQILRIKGAAKLFDIAALHPYTKHPTGVLQLVRLFRHALDAGGAKHTPILIDEFGWTSSLGQSPQHFGVETTEAGQQKNVDQAIRLFARNRSALNIAGFDYYNWAGVEFKGTYEFEFSGLYRIVTTKFFPKPVLGAYRHDALALEHCARKSTDARRCARRR